MPLDDETRRRPADFPEDGTDYEHMTPGERIEALIRISRLAYAIDYTKLAHDDPRRQLSLLPNRLIGGPLKH